MSKQRFVMLLILLMAILIRNVESQTTGTSTTGSTSAPITGTSSAGTTNTGTSSTGTEGTSSNTGTTAPFTGSSTTATPFTVSTASTITASTGSTTVLPTAQIGGTYGPCPVLPPAPNATLQNLIGTWYVMSYQPANAGPIVDQCDRLQISSNQLTLYSMPKNNPISSSNLQTESAPIQSSVSQGTFIYTMPGYYGNPLQGYVTILSYSSIGFIYNVCWLNGDANLQNLVLCATSQVNPTACTGLVANASYWESQWTVNMQQVNQIGC